MEVRECHILSSGVLVTDKRMDLWYPLLNPSRTAGFLVAESQIVDIHLSFPQMLMESVAVVQVNQEDVPQAEGGEMTSSRPA